MPEPDQKPTDPRPDHDPSTSPKVGEKEGWVEKLAMRSTGLPEQETPSSKGTDGDNLSLWKLGGLGIQFAGTVALFGWIGHEVDLKMGWSPWCLVGLTMIGVIGNLYLLIKEGMQDSRGGKK